ncbi:MAG: MFS transporter [Duncaniella sp.]|nr:MFS transporter [Duncaniella sp.]
MKPSKSPWWWVPTLYFAEGLPYIAVMTLSVILYKRMGLSNTDIALYTGWLYLPWVIKPIWSPLVDMFSSKRRWIVVMQLCIAIALAGVALTLPMDSFFTLSLACFYLVAFFSATHDIAADGFYILALDTHDQSLFVGIRSTFYRIATVAGQGGVVIAAGLMEEHLGSIPDAWSTVFMGMSLFFFLISFYHWWSLPEPEKASPANEGRPPKATVTEFFNIFRRFFTKPGITTALLFMLLYRLPEAMLVKLINPFLLDPASAGGMGLSTGQVGFTYGTIGIIGLTLGGIIGGIVVSRGGLSHWLRPMAWSMSLTCLTFLYLSLCPESSLLTVNVCVFIEQFGYGFGFTAYMLYLIYFVEGPDATAHYSICTGFMALGMMLPGMAAGWIQEQLGYPMFFALTIACCALTIGVASMLKINPSFGKK